MDESDIGSMDSFVDIVANTVGVVIVLTVLTISNADKTGIEQNVDRKKLSELNKAVRVVKADMVRLAKEASASLSEAGAAKAKISLNSLEEAEAALSQAKAALDAIGKRRKAAEDEARGVSARLSDLKVEEAGHESAIEIAKKAEAELASEMPDFDLGELDRGSLANMRESVTGLESQVSRLTRDKKANETTYGGLRDLAKQLDERAKGLERQISGLVTESQVVVEVRGPPARRDYTRFPVLLECYARPAEEGDAFPRQYVRFLDAYKREEGAGGDEEAKLITPREGESTEQITTAESEFQRFLAGQGEISKEAAFLKFIVRPEAYRIFRDARKFAKAAGWEVDWQPIEAGVSLSPAPGEDKGGGAAGGVGSRRTGGPPSS